jgi:hypothetical protein
MAIKKKGDFASKDTTTMDLVVSCPIPLEDPIRMLEAHAFDGLGYRRVWLMDCCGSSAPPACTTPPPRTRTSPNIRGRGVIVRSVPRQGSRCRHR